MQEPLILLSTPCLLFSKQAEERCEASCCGLSSRLEWGRCLGRLSCLHCCSSFHNLDWKRKGGTEESVELEEEQVYQARECWHAASGVKRVGSRKADGMEYRQVGKAEIALTHTLEVENVSCL